MNTAVVINSYGIGSAPEELRLTLIENYLSVILNENHLPNFILFYADGVKLLTEGSPVIEKLKEIENKDMKLIGCKTCLNYYQLTKKFKVVNVATMIDICDIQAMVEKVITL